MLYIPLPSSYNIPQRYLFVPTNPGRFAKPTASFRGSSLKSEAGTDFLKRQGWWRMVGWKVDLYNQLIGSSRTFAGATMV